MDRALFVASDTGRVVHTRTGYDAFVPAELPPHIDWDNRVVRAVETAARAVGEMNALMSSDTSGRFFDLLMFKEATGAAFAEGQPAALEEVFTAVATGECVSRGAQLALNYVSGFRHVEARLEEMPLSLRLIREVHHLLSRGLEHSGSYPGEFRRSQNWLGLEGCGLADATLVPPPVEEMKAALDNWERHLHSTDSFPSLVKVAILHYQFEIIRPFLEYNDMALLAVMPFILRELGLARQPVPVIAGLLSKRLQEYQQRMLDVCQRGAWNEWLTFYVFGVAGVFHEALDTVERLSALRVQQLDLMQGRSELAMQSLDAAWHQPVLTVASASRFTGSPAARTAPTLGELVDLGVLEMREQSAGSVYVARDIMAVLEQPPTLSVGYPPFL